MPSAAQYHQPTIRRTPTLLVREIQPTAAAGTYLVFDLPADSVILQGGIKVRTVGTGGGNWKLSHSEGPTDLTATVINSTANDVELMLTTDAVHGKKAAAAAAINVIGAGTLTTAAVLMCWVLAYREDYGS
jgi:hypothetical protein